MFGFSQKTRRPCPGSPKNHPLAGLSVANPTDCCAPAGKHFGLQGCGGLTGSLWVWARSASDRRARRSTYASCGQTTAESLNLLQPLFPSFFQVDLPPSPASSLLPLPLPQMYIPNYLFSFKKLKQTLFSFPL